MAKPIKHTAADLAIIRPFVDNGRITEEEIAYIPSSAQMRNAFLKCAESLFTKAVKPLNALRKIVARALSSPKTAFESVSKVDAKADKVADRIEVAASLYDDAHNLAEFQHVTYGNALDMMLDVRDGKKPVLYKEALETPFEFSQVLEFLPKPVRKHFAPAKAAAEPTPAA